MLYAEWSYSSLIEYCMKDLGYSEPAAYRRITAMRLIHELPELEKKVEEGALSLSVFVKAQTVFRHQAKVKQKFNREEKQAVLQSLENLSVSGAEKVLVEIAPEMPARENSRQLRNGEMEVTYKLTVQLQEQIEELQN